MQVLGPGEVSPPRLRSHYMRREHGLPWAARRPEPPHKDGRLHTCNRMLFIYVNGNGCPISSVNALQDWQVVID